jgi:hypothetical protein
MKSAVPCVIGGLALACVGVIAGCDNGLTNGYEPPPHKPPEFKPLTEKENLISNLVLSYDSADIGHYEELLHSDYTWYFRTADAERGLPVFWTREPDLEATKNLFLAVRGQYSDRQMNLDALQLQIEGGSWAQVDSLAGSPCDDCWVTTRQYLVNAVLTGGLDGFAGDGLVQIIVAPAGEGTEKVYKIWRMQDIKIAGPDR